MTKWLADRDLALVAAGVAVCMVVGPMLDTYLLGIATTMLVFVSLTAAWHLVGGYLGQLSIGHSALFGAGAYAAAIAGADPTTPFLLVLLAGAAGAVLVAILIAPSFRARGIYFAIATLGVTGLMNVLAVYTAPGGNLGIVLPFRFAPFSTAPFYWALFLTALTLVTIRILMRSRHGLIIRAIRDDQGAADSLGVNPVRYKIAVLVVSAALTGLIGAFYAARTAFVDPDTAFDVMLNVRLILMAILGGIGTFWGSVAGAAFITIADEVLRVHIGPEAAMISYAALLIILTLRFPQGFAGILRGGSPRPSIAGGGDGQAPIVSDTKD